MRTTNIQRRLHVSAVAVAIHVGFGAAAWGAGALPQGASVVNGQVLITKPTDNSLQIKASAGSIINWQQFSIGTNGQVRFTLPTASSAVLNRVVGTTSSQLLGALQSNGRVFLINPNGIVVGAGARIDTNSFIASTLDMSDGDFLAGKLRFLAASGAGGIRNDGVISAGPGGRIALIAPDIQNTGIIQAPGGQILLAAGRKLEISSLDFEGVSFEIQAPTDAVLNLGKLLAENGAVSAFAGTLRHSGEIRASRMVLDSDGSIRLSGSNEVTLGAGSVTAADGLGRGGSITVQSSKGSTHVAGSLSATGAAGPGGSIAILGQRVALDAGARVDASGDSGGGQILVGGDFQGKNAAVQNASRVYVDSDASLKADAVHSGDGGKVVVWADENTRYFGSLSARGGAMSGQGGSAEVSGKQNLVFAGSADLGATAGASGSLLLDPLDILVSGSGGILPSVVDQFADFASNVVTISPTAMNNVKGTVTLQAQRDIYFNDAVSLTTAGAGLNATAGDSSQSNAGAGQIYLNQNISTNGGAVRVQATGVSGAGTISSNGGAVDIKTVGSESYSAAISSGGGAVHLESQNSTVRLGDVNAGSGSITVTTSTGAISGGNLTAGTVILSANGGSVSNVHVNAATQVNAFSSNGSVSLYSLAGQPLRLGTLSAASSVSLNSDAGFAQASGGLTTATAVYLYANSANATAGTVAAPLSIASPVLWLNNLAAGAHIGFAGNPTLTDLRLIGNLAGLSTTTLTGAANLGGLALGNAGGALSISADSGTLSGFGSGFVVNVSDAAISAPTLNLPGANVTLSSNAALTIGSLNAASLYATAKGAVGLGTISTTGSNGIFVSTNSCTTSYVGCAAVSPITATTLTAAGTGQVALRTYDNGDITVSGSLSAGSANLVAGNSYYTSSSSPFYSMRTSNAISVASATTSAGFSATDFGAGNITLGSLAASGSVSVNAGGSYLVSDPAAPRGKTVFTNNAIAITNAEPASASDSFAVRNTGVGDLTITGAVTRPSGSINITASNGNVTDTSNLSASSSVNIFAGSNALTLADVTSSDSSVTLNAGTTLTVGQVTAGSATSTSNSTTSLSAGGDLSFLSITSNTLPSYGQSYGYGSVTLSSTAGSIKTRQDNTSADITAGGNVTITATNASNGEIGDSSFANPLDIVSGTAASNTVSLSAGKNIGAAGKAVQVDTSGVLSVASSGGAFFVAAQGMDGTQKSLSGLKLTASAAGLGAGGTASISSLDLSVSAQSDGSTITVGDVVRSTGVLNEFRFTTLDGGLTVGNVALTSTGYNQLYLSSAGALTQTNPVSTNNISAGYINLSAGSQAVTLGNVSSADAVGNAIAISGGNITTGNLTGRSIQVNGADLQLGAVDSSSGTSKYPNYVFVPRLGFSQYVTDELRLAASGALHTGTILSGTSAYLSGQGVTAGDVSAGHNDNFYTPDRIVLQAGTGDMQVGNVSGYDVTLQGTHITTGTVSANRTLSAGDSSTQTLTTGDLSNTGVASYGAPSINLNAGTFATGNVSTTGAINVTANDLGSQIYAPANSLTTSNAVTITAANGIDLRALSTNPPRLNAPTVTFNTDTGGIQASLAGTTTLTINTGGRFTVSSTAALGRLTVQADGVTAGAGAGSSVSDGSGSTVLSLVDSTPDVAGATTLMLMPSSAAIIDRYVETNATITSMVVNTEGTLASGSSIFVSTPAAHIATPSVTLSNGSLQLSSDGAITLTSVSTGGGNVSASSGSGAVDLASVSTGGGALDAYAGGGALTLTAVSTGGGSVSARTAGAATDVTVASLNSGGGNVTLTADNGSVVAVGRGLHIDSRTANGASSGTTTLRAANGSVGSSTAPLKTNGAVALAVDARDAIAVDVANADLASLSVTTLASGSGAIAISNANFAGLAIGRRGALGTDLSLEGLHPLTTAAFSLTARDGNLNIEDNISNVSDLTLNAGYGVSTGNLNILGPDGSARTVSASGEMTLKAGNDVRIAGGGVPSDYVQVQGANSMIVQAGHDIRVTADGGSALLQQTAPTYYTQTLQAGNDILIQGGAPNASTNGSASVIGQGYNQSVTAGHNLTVQGGTAINASSATYATLQSSGSQTLTVANDLLIQGGSGSSASSQAYASVVTTGTQTVSANNLSVLGAGAGGYAALSGASQNARTLHGNVLVQGGSGAGAYAELVASSSSQTVGYQASSDNNFTKSLGILGGDGDGAYASVRAAGSQEIHSLGAITVQAGTQANTRAEIVSGSGDQTVGATASYVFCSFSSCSYASPTGSVLVKASATDIAKIAATGRQTVLAGTGGITVQSGAAAGMSASIETTGGAQSIGSSSTSSNVATANVRVSADTGAAWIRASGNQTIQAGGDIQVLGGTGSDATASLESTASSQNIGYTYVFSNDPTANITVAGGTGTGAAAWIKAATGQTLDAGNTIRVSAGAAGAYADVVATTGTQTIGNRNGSSYDPTDSVALRGGSGSGAYARLAALAGSQSVQTTTSIALSGGSADASGALLLATTGQSVTTGTLSITGGTASSTAGNESGLRNTTSGAQNVQGTAGISLAGGGAGSDTWIKQAGPDAQSISTGGDLALSATTAGAKTVSIEAGAGGQSIAAGNTIQLDNGGANAMLLASGGDQTINARAMSILLRSSTGSAPTAAVTASGDQMLTLSGNLPAQAPATTPGAATLSVRNLSATAGSQALLQADGKQTIAMNYLSAGLMQIGDVAAQGASKVYAAGDQTLVVGSLLVQGGTSAAATATLSAGTLTSGTMLVSTLAGTMQVQGGAAGSALIDPLNLNAVSNGSILVTGGAGSTAAASVAAGVINMAATNGNMAVIGGGAPATVVASSTATATGVNSFNLNNAGGLTISAGTISAAAGGQLMLGGACTGCASGLVGPFAITFTAPAPAPTITSPDLPALSQNYASNLLVSDLLTILDQSTLDLVAAGYELVVAEDGTVTSRRRSLNQCY